MRGGMVRGEKAGRRKEDKGWGGGGKEMEGYRRYWI